MPTVVAAVVRCGRAFSGVAAARVVGDVGGYRAAMIARMCAPGRSDRGGARSSLTGAVTCTNARIACGSGSVDPMDL
jgi:hypothetical protein